jgi:hypothetical protein
LYLGRTTRRYFLTAFASGFGSLRSARHWSTPENRSAKSSIASPSCVIPRAPDHGELISPTTPTTHAWHSTSWSSRVHAQDQIKTSLTNKQTCVQGLFLTLLPRNVGLWSGAYYFCFGLYKPAGSYAFTVSCSL